MYRLIVVVLLTGVFVNGEVNNDTTLSKLYSEMPSNRLDDYINMNRQNYENNIKVYDQKLDNFKKIYTERVGTINIQMDMLLDSVIQTEQRLNPLEVLNDTTKECVVKYRSSIPTVAYIKTAITNCINTANNAINSLLSTPLNTRNTLQNYYTNTFEKSITNCENKWSTSSLNYTSCITSLTSTTNAYTVSNQKTFASQMDSARCTANANIKRALDCSFTVQNRTISSISEANTLINRCLNGQDDCSRCDQQYLCPNVYYLKDYEVDYKNTTMLNPFYGQIDPLKCLTLRIY